MARCIKCRAMHGKRPTSSRSSRRQTLQIDPRNMNLNRKSENMNDINRIAINTGGGDAPGLNAVIHAAVHAARNHDWEIFGIRDGFDGLLYPESYPEGGLMKLTRPLVRNIAHLGGTILGTSNYGNPFKLRVPQPGGSFKEIDRSDEVVRW